jgi:hypothetical protein
LNRSAARHPCCCAAPGWQHPVIAGGKLYLRNQDELFVYDIKAGP